MIQRLFQWRRDAAVATVAATAPTAPTAASAPSATAEPAVCGATTSLAEESRRAALLLGQSRKAVVSLFNEARMGRTLDTGACVEMVNEIAASVWRNPGSTRPAG